MKNQIYPGLAVQTLMGEIDTDHAGVGRKTPAGTWGHISGHNHADHWDLSFPNGGWVVVTEAELRDAAQYKLEGPQTLEQRALALQYGQNHLRLTIFDPSMVTLTEEVAGNPEQILALVKELHEIREDARDMLVTLRNAWNRWDHLDQEDNPTLGNNLARLSEPQYAWEPHPVGNDQINNLQKDVGKVEAASTLA